VVFVLWGSANLVDNVRVIRAAHTNPEASPHRELTEFLLSHQIRYARANYWDAYVVDFLSAERVIVASFGPARIPEYERDVNANREAAVHIERLPCEGWMQVANWCIQLPARLPDGGPR
jgi:very-short-patch-repair endonuclease